MKVIKGVWIYQNAWFHLGLFDETVTKTYKIRDSKNGLYAFIIDGEAEIEGQKLNTRDGFGIWEKKMKFQLRQRLTQKYY